MSKRWMIYVSVSTDIYKVKLFDASFFHVPEYGNAACTATITATRDGKTVGTLEVKTALHAAYLWPKEVMSK